MIRLKYFGRFFFLSLLICFSFLLVNKSNAQVSFTYTAPVTDLTVGTGELTAFNSTLTNTGSSSETFDIDMIEKPPTPTAWWIRFCSGGACHDSLVTHSTVYLTHGEPDHIILDILPRVGGTGKVTMRITSQTNPSLKDSITFTLNAGAAQVPLLSDRFLIFFILLILSSGSFMLWRRLKLSKVTET